MAGVRASESNAINLPWSGSALQLYFYRFMLIVHMGDFAWGFNYCNVPILIVPLVRVSSAK